MAEICNRYVLAAGLSFEFLTICWTLLAFWRTTTKAIERLAEDEYDDGTDGSITTGRIGGVETAAWLY